MDDAAPQQAGNAQQPPQPQSEPSSSGSKEPQVEEMLREQGEDEQSIQALAPAVLRLGEWQAPLPGKADTERLLLVLLPMLPASVPDSGLATVPSALSMEEPGGVRGALRERLAQPRSRLIWIFEVIFLQGMLARPSFWLASAFISALGMLVAIFSLPGNEAIMLRLVGPLLAALGVAGAFRSVRLNMLEIELSCPASALRLTIARLVLVLSYDLVLGLAVSAGLVLLNGQEGHTGDAGLLVPVLTTVWHWFAPLLLVAGLALLLSLRLPAETAAGLAYAGWLVLLLPALVEKTEQGQNFFNALLAGGEPALAACGAVLAWVALLRLRSTLSRLLPS